MDCIKAEVIFVARIENFSAASQIDGTTAYIDQEEFLRHYICQSNFELLSSEKQIRLFMKRRMKPKN